MWRLINNLLKFSAVSFPDLIRKSSLFEVFWIVRSSRTMTNYFGDSTLEIAGVKPDKGKKKTLILPLVLLS